MSIIIKQIQPDTPFGSPFDNSAIVTAGASEYVWKLSPSNSAREELLKTPASFYISGKSFSRGSARCPRESHKD